jgi:hypothetical protein
MLKASTAFQLNETEESSWRHQGSDEIRCDVINVGHKQRSDMRRWKTLTNIWGTLCSVTGNIWSCCHKGLQGVKWAPAVSSVSALGHSEELKEDREWVDVEEVVTTSVVKNWNLIASIAYVQRANAWFLKTRSSAFYPPGYHTASCGSQSVVYYSVCLCVCLMLEEDSSCVMFYHASLEIEDKSTRTRLLYTGQIYSS